MLDHLRSDGTWHSHWWKVSINHGAVCLACWGCQITISVASSYLTSENTLINVSQPHKHFFHMFSFKAKIEAQQCTITTQLYNLVLFSLDVRLRLTLLSPLKNASSCSFSFECSLLVCKIKKWKHFSILKTFQYLNELANFMKSCMIIVPLKVAQNL